MFLDVLDASRFLLANMQSFNMLFTNAAKPTANTQDSMASLEKALEKEKKLRLEAEKARTVSDRARTECNLRANIQEARLKVIEMERDDLSTKVQANTRAWNEEKKNYQMQLCAVEAELVITKQRLATAQDSLEAVIDLPKSADANNNVMDTPAPADASNKVMDKLPMAQANTSNARHDDLKLAVTRDTTSDSNSKDNTTSANTHPDAVVVVKENNTNYNTHHDA